jgi:hypothetical protein
MSLVALLLGGMLTGCAGPSARPGAVYGSSEVSPSLVFAPFSPPDADAGWEGGRNDESMGIGGASGLEQWQWMEVRAVDHRWTLNGRVRESSRTTTRTLRRGIQRSE